MRTSRTDAPVGSRGRTRSAARIVSCAGAAGLVAIGLASPASAETISNGTISDSAGNYLTGGTFSTPVAPVNGFNTFSTGQTFDGWTVVGNGVNQNSSTFFPTPVGDPSSTQSVDLSGNDSNSTGTDGISQTIPTVAGQTYSVLFELAGNTQSGPAVKAGIVTVNGTQIGPEYFFDTTGHSASSSASMGWTPQTYTFTATSASSTIDFISKTTTGYGPLITDVTVPVITQTEVAIPAIAACNTGTLDLHAQTDQSWTSDTNIPPGPANTMSITSNDGNTQISPTEVTGGPFTPGASDLFYGVTVGCATPPGLYTATVPSGMTAGGQTAQIQVEINVLSSAGAPLLDWRVAGPAAGALGLGALGWTVLRRRRNGLQAA